MRRELFIKYLIIALFISIFIIGYFYLMLKLSGISNIPSVPFFLVLGFLIIILGVFYFFINFKPDIEGNNTFFSFKCPNENVIKLILLILMVITFFIPPISFSDSVIDWTLIRPLNYFRGCVFLIGSIFLPGANIYKLVFPRDTLSRRFNIDPLLLKITLYPFFSFLFLSFSSIILDFIGLKRDYFTYILFILMIIFCVFDLYLNKKRGFSQLNLNSVKIKVSKITLLLLFLSIGIIIVAFGILLSTKYLIPGDSWEGIGYAYYIGREETTQLDKLTLYIYEINWGYISFSLSTLSGIPYINVNAMLFPLLYLYITSLYLSMKAILYGFKESYALLSTIILVIFSGLFYILNYSEGRLTPFAYNGIYSFFYRSYAYFSLFISIGLFLIVLKTYKRVVAQSFIKSIELKIIICSSLFLLQSYMTYYIPAIAGISLFIIFSLFSDKKKQNIKFFIIFWIFFTFFFIIFDVLSTFLLSWTPFKMFSKFLGVGEPNLTTDLIYIALIAYMILGGFLVLIYCIYLINNKFFYGDSNEHYKFKINHRISKVVFISILSGFSILLGTEIFYIVLREISHNSVLNQSFFALFLDLIFLYIGFIGISGIYLSYCTYKKNKQLFYILLSWSLFIFCLSFIFIFRRWLEYPFISPSEIPQRENKFMMYWFYRIWPFIFIPLSILFSIGILRIRKNLKKKKILTKINRYIKLIFILGFISSLIFLTFSNTIIRGIYWKNKRGYFEDEEVQLIGWMTKHIPQDSNIVFEKRRKLLGKVSFAPITPFYIENEIQYALENYPNSSNINDSNHSIMQLNRYKYLAEYQNSIDIDTQIIINHLKTRNIKYFIIDKQREPNYESLLSFFFNITLYTYQGLTIYYSGEI